MDVPLDDDGEDRALRPFRAGNATEIGSVMYAAAEGVIFLFLLCSEHYIFFLSLRCFKFSCLMGALTRTLFEG